MRTFTRITVLLLLTSGCDLKLGDGEEDEGGEGHSTGESYSSTGEMPPDGTTSGGATMAPTSTTGPEPCDSGDTETPVSSSSTTHPGGDSGDTETPVSSSSTTRPGDSGDTEWTSTGSGPGGDSGDTEWTGSGPGGETDSGGDESDSDAHSTGLVEEDCGSGAGAVEDGTWCALSITCTGQPALEMNCDSQTCVCFVDGLEVGSCEADEICLDFSHIQDKGPGCCGFPAVSI